MCNAQVFGNDARFVGLKNHVGNGNLRLCRFVFVIGIFEDAVDVHIVVEVIGIGFTEKRAVEVEHGDAVLDGDELRTGRRDALDVIDERFFGRGICSP